MSVYSDPPVLRDFRQDKPTLLVCWWATTFCAFMIVSRLIGRLIRTERLFPEDKIAALALVPLFLRMGCVDFVLKMGTNNANFVGAHLTAHEVHDKAIASGLVLASRALYAATLWILKAAILGFLRRITDLTWERSYHAMSTAIRWTLVVTFLAVIISDVAECRPFKHYWQVLPDPGGQCRQGYAQLITMATCNVVTDMMLVVFPVSIIMRSKMAPCRKLQLVLLFSLSLSVVGVTLFRVIRVIDHQGVQQYRSLLASVELIFATASANALVLGSFIRDRGVKKHKFRRRSTPISYDPPTVASRTRRPTTIQRQWGSDEDLVWDLGLSIDPELRDQPNFSLSPNLFRKAPALAPLSPGLHDHDRWDVERQREPHDSNDVPAKARKASHPSKHLSLLDVGGLLDESAGTSSGGSWRRGSQASSSIDPLSTTPALPSVSRSASISGQRRGSTAPLQDVGGLLAPPPRGGTLQLRRNGVDLDPIPQSDQGQGPIEEPELMDPGGLLR